MTESVILMLTWPSSRCLCDPTWLAGESGGSNCFECSLCMDAGVTKGFVHGASIHVGACSTCASAVMERPNQDEALCSRKLHASCPFCNLAAEELLSFDAGQNGPMACKLCKAKHATHAFVHGSSFHAGAGDRCARAFVKQPCPSCPVCKQAVERLLRFYTV